MIVHDMDSDHKLGNYVILECDDVQIVLAHLRKGTVQVAAGEPVAKGDKLGEVGNSGNSSEPHLHLHVQRPPAEGAAPISGEPVPFTIDGRYLVRNAKLIMSGG
jgi:murein DD-endopeptidase MepM/ murein hydrolase activator NlpD